MLDLVLFATFTVCLIYGCFRLIWGHQSVSFSLFASIPFSFLGAIAFGKAIYVPVFHNIVNHLPPGSDLAHAFVASAITFTFYVACVGLLGFGFAQMSRLSIRKLVG